MATDNEDWADWNTSGQSTTTDDSWAQFGASAPSNNIDFGSSDIFAHSNTSSGLPESTTAQDSVPTLSKPDSSSLVVRFLSNVLIFTLM